MQEGLQADARAFVLACGCQKCVGLEAWGFGVGV